MVTLQELRTRRESIVKQMVVNSVAIFFSAPEIIRNRDTEYPYRQNSDFWYLTSFNEPEAVFIIFKDKNCQYKTLLFNRIRDINAEIWFGRRLGQEAALQKLAVDEAFTFDSIDDELCLLLNNLDVIYHAVGQYDYADKILFSALAHLRRGSRQSLCAPPTITDWRPLLHEKRLIKSAEEIEIMRKSAEINIKAHLRAMAKCQPGLYEYQLEAEILYEFGLHGARYPSYNTIVGCGENGCILHYTENESLLQDNQLVLIDAGCEYQCYASDITRTFPVNGKFSREQRAIYDIVLAAQYAALNILGPGCSINEANQAVIRIMVTGLIELGILQGDIEELITNRAYSQFYMHSLGHWLGLDVHDVGDYETPTKDRLLLPGMVLTVEPGLYISAMPNVEKKWHNIGIRIEDNILITESGNEIITAGAIKDPDEIEVFMSKSRC